MRVCIAQYGGNGGTEHVGAAMAHTVTCGGGAGLFLRVRDCELLLLAAPARGAKLPAPYLDSYGETDQVLLSTSTLPLSIRYCLCIILILPVVFFFHSHSMSVVLYALTPFLLILSYTRTSRQTRLIRL